MSFRPAATILPISGKTVRGGISAAAPIARFDASKLPVKIGAEVKGFDIGRYASAKKFKHYELTVQYGVAAASLAVKDSGIEIEKLKPDRTSVVEGTTISGAVCVINLRDSYHSSDTHSYRALHPYNVVGGYCGEGSSTISLHLGIHGHAVTYCSGCASGNDAIGYAAHLIRCGRRGRGGGGRIGGDDGIVAHRAFAGCAR